MSGTGFDWSALPGGLLRQLQDDLGIEGDDVPGALAGRFGAAPTEDFVKATWSALRDRWIAKDPVVRRSVVAALRARGLGSGAQGSSAHAEVAYLRSCRNSPGLRGIVLSHLLALGEPLSPIGSKPPPHAARAGAWEAFARTLALNLAQLEVDQFLLLSTRRTPARYVQFAQQGPSGVRAETASNEFLDGEEALDDGAQARLVELGWKPPTNGPEEPRDPEGSPNWFRDWPLPVPYPEVALMAVRTLDEVLDVRHPGFLMYDAFARGGAPIILPNLGLVRDQGRAPVAASDDAPRASPSGPDELVSKVKDVVRTVLGLDEVLVDNDGDIPIPSQASLTYVRVFKEAPVVRVFSPVLWGLGNPSDIEETVNDINRSTNWVKAVWDNGTVVLFSDVVGDPLAESQLAAAIRSIVNRADEVGPALQQKYGGRTAFGAPLPPRQTKIGGYL